MATYRALGNTLKHSFIASLDALTHKSVRIFRLAENNNMFVITASFESH